MAQQKIEAFDVERMLFGEAPPEFLIEVFFRGLALYLFMLFIVRLLGKRMAGELTITEMVLMITLGGSVAVAMQVPEGGALIGFVVLICAFVFERIVSKLTLASKKFETVSQGSVAILIRDGVLQKDKMKDTRVTKEQLFAALRHEKVHQLGQVERLYLEAGGGFSIYKYKNDAPAGLAVYPEEDTILEEKKASGDMQACYDCGFLLPVTMKSECNHCHGNKWVKAIN